MQPAPLRSLNDFLIVFARFQFPNFSDSEKWGRRVKFNLIYFQSNYFLSWIVIFFLVGLFHPMQMVLGLVTASAMFLLYKLYLIPFLGPASVLIGIAVILYFIESVFIFIFSVSFCFTMTFIHATLRLRGLDNKLSNMRNSANEIVTPMEMFLDQLCSLPILRNYPFFQNNVQSAVVNEEICESDYEFVDSEQSTSIPSKDSEIQFLTSNQNNKSPGSSTTTSSLDKNLQIAIVKVAKGLDKASEKLTALVNSSSSPKDDSMSSTSTKSQGPSSMDKNIKLAAVKASEGLDYASEKLSSLSSQLKNFRKK